jgi:hypothetical protein
LQKEFKEQNNKIKVIQIPFSIRMNISIKDNLSFHSENEQVVFIEETIDFHQSMVMKGMNLFAQRKLIEENNIYQSDFTNEIPSFEMKEKIEPFQEKKKRKIINIKKISSLIYETLCENEEKLNYEKIERLLHEENETATKQRIFMGILHFAHQINIRPDSNEFVQLKSESDDVSVELQKK